MKIGSAARLLLEAWGALAGAALQHGMGAVALADLARGVTTDPGTLRWPDGSETACGGWVDAVGQVLERELGQAEE